MSDYNFKVMKVTVFCCCFVNSLVPYREKATESAGSAVTKRKPYSPFQPKLDNAADYALARVDDLVNWARKVQLLIY